MLYFIQVMKPFKYDAFTKAYIETGEPVWITPLGENSARIETSPITSRLFTHGDIVRANSTENRHPEIVGVVKHGGNKTAIVRADWNEDVRLQTLLKAWEEKAFVTQVDDDLIAISASDKQLRLLLELIESREWSTFVVRNESPISPAKDNSVRNLDVSYFARIWLKHEAVPSSIFKL